ncbi:uncharacterized protein GIQ15_03297 [Arthroderma uncinatum]|uniref:uncharacterized protein n=1 Tax=Arthroderma uncinatum TaxID=74035 RepID=UPI00144A5D61|nr:uncharacterized protein GIQ15_03297 [Arthroderma uncinatum]KAF3483973.1 hypothetical protein GIQ15_03297 [Arthroderma uncinatum]
MMSRSASTIGNTARPKVVLPTKEPTEALSMGTDLVSQSGTHYRIDRILQHKTEPTLSCVYLATAKDGKKHVIKNIFHTEFEYQLDLQAPLAGCPNLRVVIDTIPEHLLFVYDYSTEDLLDLVVKKELPHLARKMILRDTLAGLAAMHKHGITRWVKRTQIGDLEMGSMIPPGLNVRGALLGNPMWRSPESHAAARINIPSDVFSFGLVCIFTMLRKIIFRIDEGSLSRAEKERIIVKRLLSHFGDGPGLVGFLHHLEDNSAKWRDLVVTIADEFTPADPRYPFSIWEDVDESFRDIIVKMTSLDPARRITAKDALEHPWFKDIHE